MLETINPACWVAFFESYLRDLTHVRPCIPRRCSICCARAAFTTSTSNSRRPLRDRAADRLPRPASDDARLPDLVDTFNENVAKLNARLFTYQDYAAVGRA